MLLLLKTIITILNIVTINQNTLPAGHPPHAARGAEAPVDLAGGLEGPRRHLVTFMIIAIIIIIIHIYIYIYYVVTTLLVTARRAAGLHGQAVALRLRDRRGEAPAPRLAVPGPPTTIIT